MGLDNVCIETTQRGVFDTSLGRAAESCRASKRGIRIPPSGLRRRDSVNPWASPAQLLPLPVGCNMSRMRDKNFSY